MNYILNSAVVYSCIRYILCDGAGVLNHRDTVYTAMSDTHTAEEFLAIRKERSKGNCFSFELENLGLDEGQYT